MLIGIQTAQIGRFAGPDTIRSTALAAEQIGYSSIWVHDRLRVPVDTVDAGPGLGPPRAGRALDPFVVLAAIAAVTGRGGGGTRVLPAPG
jgi:alkanesulfonate monooxygenase SsuD/methylene tetrahydromethanopterin reductase-like flavin-dependent oxidoreductase (luciferase family)